jgi:hypothetical protein
MAWESNRSGPAAAGSSGRGLRQKTAYDTKLKCHASSQQLQTKEDAMRHFKIISVLVMLMMSISAVCLAVDCPKELASIFPMCKDAKVLQTTQLNDALITSLQTSDAMEVAYTAYKTAAQQNGWKMLMETKQDDATTVMLQKDDRQMVMNVAKDEAGTIIHLTVGKKN